MIYGLLLFYVQLIVLYTDLCHRQYFVVNLMWRSSVVTLSSVSADYDHNKEYEQKLGDHDSY